MFAEKKLILYGAGSDIKKAISLLMEAGKTPLCIADSNSKKWTDGLWGIPIVLLN